MSELKNGCISIIIDCNDESCVPQACIMLNSSRYAGFNTDLRGNGSACLTDKLFPVDPSLIKSHAGSGRSPFQNIRQFFYEMPIFCRINPSSTDNQDICFLHIELFRTSLESLYNPGPDIARDKIRPDPDNFRVSRSNRLFPPAYPWLKSDHDGACRHWREGAVDAVFENRFRDLQDTISYSDGGASCYKACLESSRCSGWLI